MEFVLPVTQLTGAAGDPPVPRDHLQPNKIGVRGGGVDLLTLTDMRDCEAIDSELRLVAAVRGAIREAGGPLPISQPINDLVDERLLSRRPAPARTPTR
jgi:hypothetical protein